MTIVYVFAGLVLLRVVVIGLGAALLIRRVTDCPACFRESIGIRYAWLSWIVPWLEWRWCPSCGWEGPSRKSATPFP